jgi:hypothetical protein
MVGDQPQITMGMAPFEFLDPVSLAVVFFPLELDEVPAGIDIVKIVPVGGALKLRAVELSMSGSSPGCHRLR